ncbi:MAG TPA: extracellular solute-binding protein [Gemmatimonadaceae bacterium]|nr:extracellular solute-binding protein [Gemmatimonadaceae bacterium]
MRCLAPVVLVVAACSRPAPKSGDTTAATGGGTIVVYTAASVAIPVRAALDTFAAREHVTVQQANGGSLDIARRLTELHDIPDVVVLADYDVFPKLLIPEQTTWYADFARNRMVLAFTDKSKFASEVDSANWPMIVQRPGVQLGRANPDLDPNGYRTLLTMRLAEQYYNQPGLYAKLMKLSPAKNVRPKEADLVGVLQAGEFDYIWSYESLALATKLRYITLPSAIDLGAPADTDIYAKASVRVTGNTPRDTLTIKGEPIVYALSIPKAAPHPDVAEKFVAFLLSPEGRKLMHATKLDALDTPVIIGSGAPASVRAAARAQ